MKFKRPIRPLLRYSFTKDLKIYDNRKPKFVGFLRPGNIHRNSAEDYGIFRRSPDKSHHIRETRGIPGRKT